VTNAIQTQLTSNVPVAGVIIINKLKSVIEFHNFKIILGIIALHANRFAVLPVIEFSLCG